MSKRQGDSKQQLSGVFHKLIVDYYQNLEKLEHEKNNNQVLTVPVITAHLQESQEQILDRKLTLIEKAELKFVTEKLKTVEKLNEANQN